MAKSQEVKEFYRPEELTGGLLEGMVDEREPRRKPLMQFVEPIAHDEEYVEVDILTEHRDRFANIVGFSDSSVLVRGLETETRYVSPFHIKNAYEFKSAERGDVLEKAGRGPRDWEISDEGLAEAIDDLEERRANLQFFALASMLNDKQFVYDNGDLPLTVSYADEVLDLTPAGTPIDAAGDPYYEMDMMFDEYYAVTGQRPNLAFINGLTSAKLKANTEIAKKMQVTQPSDPDVSGASFNAFEVNGVLFVVLHDKYPVLTGGTKKAVADGEAMVTVLQDERTGQRPIQLHRASNILNRNNASGPSYDAYVLAEDPFALAIRLYDNMIPGLSRRGIVQKWKMW